MADWKQFSDYLEVRYKIDFKSDSGNIFRLLFNLDGGRSQFVLIGKNGNDKVGDWVDIVSPIGPMTDSQVRQAAIKLSDMVVGGLVCWDDGTACLRHSLSLASFVASDFEWIMEAVLSTADELEEQILGSDAM